MTRTTRGLLFGLLSVTSFGTSGAFMKPLLEAGWTPAAAVTMRVLVGGLLLAPLAALTLRGKWNTLWVGRWRILGMGVVGVSATQLVYFAALQRIPVSTALLIEYLAPLLLVGWAWASTRRMPAVIILVGSAVALAGLVLVIGPGDLGTVDLLGIGFAGLAAVGCAGYYLVAERPSRGLPPVAFASASLLLGGVLLGLAGVTGLVPFAATFGEVPFPGGVAPWWVPLGIVALISTAVAYASGVTASQLLGSRLMSFVGLLEVIAASLFAWILIGEALGPWQLVGGALVLAGIAFVRMEKRAAADTGAATDARALALATTAVEHPAR